jgi:multidrug transporter EmrE-like cation transporter
MKLTTMGLILLSVLLSASAQIAFKSGMVAASTQSALADGLSPRLAWALASDLRIVGGFVLYAASAGLWLWVLARTELSVAYPFVSVGFVITMLAGAFAFGESLTFAKLAGTALVCCGVALLASAR